MRGKDSFADRKFIQTYFCIFKGRQTFFIFLLFEIISVFRVWLSQTVKEEEGTAETQFPLLLILLLRLGYAKLADFVPFSSSFWEPPPQTLKL